MLSYMREKISAIVFNEWNQRSSIHIVHVQMMQCQISRSNYVLYNISIRLKMYFGGLYDRWNELNIQFKSIQFIYFHHKTSTNKVQLHRKLIQIMMEEMHLKATPPLQKLDIIKFYNNNITINNKTHSVPIRCDCTVYMF